MLILAIEFSISYELIIGVTIEISLRGIARNDCFRLRHFTARNCAIIDKKEAFKYLWNCADLRGIARKCVQKADPESKSLFSIVECSGYYVVL